MEYSLIGVKRGSFLCLNDVLRISLLKGCLKNIGKVEHSKCVSPSLYLLQIYGFEDLNCILLQLKHTEENQYRLLFSQEPVAILVGSEGSEVRHAFA